MGRGRRRGGSGGEEGEGGSHERMRCCTLCLDATRSNSMIISILISTCRRRYQTYDKEMITERRGGGSERPSPLVPASRDEACPGKDRSSSSEEETRSQSGEGGRRHPGDEVMKGRLDALGSGWMVEERRRKGSSKLRRWGRGRGEGRLQATPR